MENYIKVAIFPATFTREQVLSSNGKNLTEYCTYAMTDESYSNYVIDLTFTSDVAEYINEEDIIKVKMDYGYEIFRISKIDKKLRYIDVTARQIAIADILNYWLDDVRPTDTTGLGALNYLLTNSTSRNKEIMFSSNIDTISTAYYQDINVYKALYDCDQSFINRWGGESLFRQYKVTINKRIGKDSKVTIREGKNLTGFSGVSNTDELVTRACGKGYNGIKGDYIESPLINNYVGIYNKVFEFSDVRLKTDASTTQEDNILYFDTLDEAKIELNNRIKKKFEEEQIDRLKATYTINFVDLEQTLEYKNYSHAEKVNLGDTVRVYVPKLDTDIKVRVTNKKYDVLAQRTKEISLSNEVIANPIKVSDIITELQRIENATNNPVGDYINAMQQAGLQNSYVICRENEILVMDQKDINTATNIVKINKNGLFFGNNGYYGDFSIGFTIDGVINADHIRTGILTAIIIKSANDNCYMDLNSGEVNFKKGRIGSISTYLDATNGKFVTKGKVLDEDNILTMASGYISNNGILRIINKRDDCSTDSDILLSHDNNGESGIVISSGSIQLMAMSSNSPLNITSNNTINISGDNGEYIGFNGGTTTIRGNLEIKGNLTINGVKVYAGTGGGSGSGGTILNGSWWDIAFEMVGREESGHSDPGCISNISWDAGGKSYGAYQFSLNMGSLSEFVNWLQTEGSAKATNWYNRLSAHALGSDAFDSEWKAIANEDHDGFLHIQQKRMIVSFYKPALNEIAKVNSGFVAGSYTVGLNACILSTAIQFGPGGYNSNGSVWSYVFGSGSMDEPSMLLRFKESRTAYFSATSERYAREYNDTLNMYNTYQPKPFGDGYGSPNGGSALQQAVVESARKLIGKPYRYGGNYPPLGSDDGTDCSGLMQWAYNDNGISISRTTYTQIGEGTEVVESQLQPGDLVFPRGKTDNGHVFMYSGESNGSHMCVEAPHTGVNITERAFTWDDSTYRARRIITS